MPFATLLDKKTLTIHNDTFTPFETNDLLNATTYFKSSLYEDITFLIRTADTPLKFYFEKSKLSDLEDYFKGKKVHIEIAKPRGIPIKQNLPFTPEFFEKVLSLCKEIHIKDDFLLLKDIPATAYLLKRALNENNELIVSVPVGNTLHELVRALSKICIYKASHQDDTYRKHIFINKIPAPTKTTITTKTTTPTTTTINLCNNNNEEIFIIKKRKKEQKETLTTEEKYEIIKEFENSDHFKKLSELGEPYDILAAAKKVKSKQGHLVFYF